MKLSIPRIIAWFIFLGCIISSFSILHSFDLSVVLGDSVYKAMTSQDVILYKLGAVLFFMVIAIGIFIDLDYFKIKDRLPLLKSHKTIQHIIYYLLVIVIAGACIYIPQQFMSDSYKQAQEAENQRIINETKS